MNRYLYYLLFLNMFVNVFLYVPQILIQERFSGSVLGIIFGVVIGCTLLFLFTRALNKFPSLGLPEILESIPKWFSFLLLTVSSVMWYGAGVVALLAFNNVTIRFFNPDISGLHMISIFSIFIIILVRLETESLLYTLEMVFLINTPLLVIIMYQAYSHEYLSWNSIREVATHISSLPSWNVISASTFVFSGYTNLIIFNRVFKEKIKLKWLWFVPFIGFFNLFTTLFIPVGMWGADGVGDLTYPWVTTADTLRIELGPIERVLSFFILFYVAISMLSISVHWHVAYKVLTALLIKKKKQPIHSKKQSLFQWGVLASFFLIVVLLEDNFVEKGIFAIGKIWLNLRFIGELILVTLLMFLARRKRA